MEDTRCQESHNNKDQVIVTDCIQISALLCVIAKLRKATVSFAMTVSVRPHGTVRIPLDVFSWKFIFWDFDWNLSFRAWPGSKLINIWGILREDACTYRQVFCGWKGKNLVKGCSESHVTHLILCKISRKSCRVWNCNEECDRTI